MSFRRKPSAPWSRLKKPPSDPLDEVGLISKGDKRLLDLKSQERYFSTIVSRYMRYCGGSSRENHSLEEAFQSLSLAEVSLPAPSRVAEVTSDSNELELIVMAMRKLREALVATARVDAFAQRVLMFITRATILTSTYEAYFPAMLRLLYQVHSETPLSQPELREFVGYHILDLACRQGSYSEALLIRQKWALDDQVIDRVLHTLMRDDWIHYWHLKNTLGTYHRRLLGFAEADVRKHALKCLGRTYLKVDKAFLEKSAGREWAELQQLDSVGWDLEGDAVVIRKIKKGS